MACGEVVSPAYNSAGQRSRINRAGRRRATMELNPYLTFNGQCEAAFKFYEHVFGGKIEFMLTYGNSPMADQVPSEWHKKVLHATLIVSGKVLQGADGPPDHEEEIKGVAVAIGLEDPV